MESFSNGSRVLVTIPSVSPRIPAKQVAGTVVGLYRSPFGKSWSVALDNGKRIAARARDMVAA